MTSIDPSDDLTFWTVQQYADTAQPAGSCFGNTGKWATWWGAVSCIVPCGGCLGDLDGDNHVGATDIQVFVNCTGPYSDHIREMATPGVEKRLRLSKGVHILLPLDERTTAGLQTVAAEAGVTLGAVAQAVWAVLLARYNQTTDVLYGLTVSGRPPELPGALRTVGCFIIMALSGRASRAKFVTRSRTRTRRIFRRRRFYSLTDARCDTEVS
jgi:hypothetical protein